MDKNIVKIILVAANAERKSLVFVDEFLRAHSLQEAIDMAKDGLLKNISVVKRSGSLYLRSKPKTPTSDQIDKISISAYKLFLSLGNIEAALSIPVFASYWKFFQELLSEKDDIYIVIDGYPVISQDAARFKLQLNKDFIFSAAEKFDIDVYLLVAILIDEIARLAPFEEITDILSAEFLGKNTSIGIAQVKTETARGLMAAGYYNPDPDKFSSKEKIKKTTRREIYEYLKEPKHNIFFAAATLRSLIDNWKKFINLKEKPEILASLYSLSRTPHKDPQPNSRGLQIANEFYKLAQDWLK